MELPVRIDPAPSTDPIVSVDGVWNAPGLNLSHWPGNRTPHDLRHDLSTGSALAFARQGERERERRAAGAVAIVNNHYDTDGVMALFAVRHPRAALEREVAMLEAAEAGDFFHIPSERGLALDALVSAWDDEALSPVRAAFAGRSEDEWRAIVLASLFEALPGLLDGDLEPYRNLWEPVVRRTREDLAALAAAEQSDFARADLAVFRTAHGPEQGPGRHALFASTRRDRVLVASSSGAAGHGYRLIIGTLSWFDLSVRRAPRPDLHALVRHLDRLEGTSPADDCAWRAEDPAGPSPELWFGTSEHPRFAEHSSALRPSALAPDEVVDAVLRYGSSSPAPSSSSSSA